ncbi:DNA translocase FtsK [candidate division KSB1 bacterium]|nr:DNA translocase FtsK [candidate division KSB1 bacterium]
MKRKKTNRKYLITGIVLITLSLLLSLSVISYNTTDDPPVNGSQSIQNMLGIAGAYASFYLINYTFGYGVIIPCLLLFLWGGQIIRHKPPQAGLKRFSVYSLCTMFIISQGFAIYDEFSSGGSPANFEYSGIVGGFFASYSAQYLGKAGTIIVYLSLTVILFVLWTHFPVLKVIGRFESLFGETWARGKSLFFSIRNTFDKNRRKKKFRESILQKKPGTPEFDIPLVPIREETTSEPKPKRDSILPQERDSGQISANDDLPFTIKHRKETAPTEIEDEPTYSSGPYQLPSLDLLNSPAADLKHEGDTKEDIIRQADILENTFLDFGVHAKVVEVQPGPVLTLYEVRPDTGVKISKILSLQDDLALAMKAKGIRIIAPIPGKDTVGIEIPNHHSSVVYLKSLLTDPAFTSAKSKLTIALGKTVTGEVYFADLAKMPHLLIAGSTGSGKSVGISTIIASILYKSSPQDVQFIMIDPKMLELSVFKNLSSHHLLTADFIDEKIITKPHNAVMILKSCVAEMERRYNIMAKTGVRNLEDYNAKPEKPVDEKTGEPFPQKLEYIVIIIDELADLMMVASKEVEEPITRLAQMARAVGIHIVLATQRPSVDVLTGVIKANFPSRIAYQVATKVDSRTVLDMNGAEQLLGSGDMLYLPPGAAKPVRMQNAFVTQKEIDTLVMEIAKQPKYRKNTVLISETEKRAKSDGNYLDGERDPLFSDAARIVVLHQQGSISLLQRRLKIGYSRAARIIDELEDAAIVGPPDGSKARQVLAEEEDLDDIL